MKSKIHLFALCLLLACGGSWTGDVVAKPLEKQAVEGAPSSMIIKSNTLEVDDKLKMVTFTGDVNAEKDNLTISCDRMVVHYKAPAGTKDSGTASTRIDKVVATGNVVIRRTEGGIATARKAVFFEDSDKVILTDHPRVKRGKDFVEGDRITIYLKENRSVVEGSRGKKVRAVIFPGKKKR